MFTIFEQIAEAVQNICATTLLQFCEFVYGLFEFTESLQRGRIVLRRYRYQFAMDAILAVPYLFLAFCIERICRTCHAQIRRHMLRHTFYS